MAGARLYEVRFHGRGGQGAVTAAELLSVAAFDAGLWAQAFPSFGSERTGAPVEAYCRFGGDPIRLREPVMTPDAVIVLDASLLHVIDVAKGLCDAGLVIVNSTGTADELDLSSATMTNARIVTVPANDIARSHIGRPLPNGVLLGAFSALNDLVALDDVLRALRARFPGAVGAANAAAATEAHQLVTNRPAEVTHA